MTRRSARCCGSARTPMWCSRRVLVVAPMSGHFATLLRGTVSVLLPDHDVYITDWKNARDIPLSDGTFGFDEYVDHLIRFLEVMGEGSHMIAVCQPAVAALAAAAVMAETRQPGTAAQSDADGRPDRHAAEPDQGQRTREIPHDRVVREETDRQGALALQGRVPARLSRVPATDGVHEHEPGPPHQRPYQPVPSPGLRRRGRGRGALEVLR